MSPTFRVLFVTLLAVVLTSVLGASPSKPHVSVPPALNLTGLPAFDPGAKAARDTVVTLLGQMGKYVLAPWKGPAPGAQTDFKPEAEAQSLDFVVQILLEKASDQRAVCRFRVWDRTKGAFSWEKTSDPVQLLDIFDVCDQTAADTLEKMSGEHLAFGSITLKPRGGTRLFTIRLDEQDLEPDRLTRVLAGSHTLEIRANDSPDTKPFLKINPLAVTEGTATEVVFLAPETMTAAAPSRTEAPTPREYKIGDWGPAMGYIFYDKGSYSDGWRYLEANPTAFQVSVQAANFSHEQGGYTDWRLPTVDEMRMIRAQLQEKGLDVYPKDKYLTSDRGSDMIYIYDMGWGIQGTWMLHGTAAAFFYAIPVRAF